MTNKVFVKEYAPPPLNEKEALFYSGIKGALSDELYTLFTECAHQVQAHCCYRICYRVFTMDEIRAVFPDCAYLHQRLIGAKYAVLFAATVGIDIDRLIARYGQISPAKAVLAQGVGAERVESLCNVFCQEIQNESIKYGFQAKARFSPGYGAFPLETQSKIIALLDGYKNIGISVTDNLLLSPTKSVTAIVPVEEI